MRLFFLLLLVGPSIFAQSKEEFILNGTVNYPSDRNIYFVWRDQQEGFRFVDSTKVINGKFTYKGKIFGFNNFFYIKTDPQNLNNNDSLNNVQVRIDNSVMNINLQVGSFSKYKLTGCKSCELLKQLLEKEEVEYHALNSMQLQLKNVAKANGNIAALQNEGDTFNKRIKKRKFDWCNNNLSNSLFAWNLYRWEEDFTDKEFISLFNNCSQTQELSYYGWEIKKIIKRKEAEQSQIGKQAFSFSKIGFDSSLVSLQTTIQKGYTILDFWASWCVPCRASHPHLIHLFKKYQSHHLNIISIAADDKTQDQWRVAVKSDSIFIWAQILEGLKEEGNLTSYNLGEDYLIHYYPTKILIDPTGKIIGRYASDNFEDIENKLKQIYKF